MKCLKCNQEIETVICPHCGTNQDNPTVNDLTFDYNELYANQTRKTGEEVEKPVELSEGIQKLTFDYNTLYNIQEKPEEEEKVESIIPSQPIPVATKPIEEQPVEEVKQTIIQQPVKKTSPLVYVLGTTMGLGIIGVMIFLGIQLLNPKIEVKKLKKEYSYTEFIKESFKVDGSLFVKPEKTIWTINGHKFAEGKRVNSIPVSFGENVLTVQSGNASATYYFEITNDTNLLTDGNFTLDGNYLDFDGDGIINIIEEEKGLSNYTSDTDGDGLFDNVELSLGLDPTTADDYNEIREYTAIQDNYKDTKNYLIVKGKGNIANTFLDSVDLNIGFSSSFVQSNTLKVTTTNSEKPEKMQIYFKKEAGWNNKKHKIYMYDELTGNLEELKTDASDQYLTAEVTNFDNIYFVGKKESVPKEYLNQIIILIDNSGSMFPKKYVTSNKNASDTAYGHDIEFKRLSLMTSLVDELGTEDYEYSVYGFTASYCPMIVRSNDSMEIKRSINRLKTECQRFNGTDMSGSIKKYATTFRDDVYGAKYIIVLTDGVDTGNNVFKLSEYYLNDYRKKGIHIVTLGLSNQVNGDYLMDIAYLTKGKYLYASDSNMLDTLSEIIKKSINKTEELIKIEEKDYSLLADSGFQVDRDGFSFQNFHSQDLNSNSFGFAYLSKQIYLNQLTGGGGNSEIITTELTDNNKNRLVKGNIYSIELSKEYKNKTVDLTDKDNLDDDYQLLQLINQAHKLQLKKGTAKIGDFVLKNFQNQFYDYDTDLNGIITELQSGSPAILILTSTAGSHAVLANKVYKIPGVEEYVITVYDSETPGTEGKIYVKRETAYYENANTSYYKSYYTVNGIEYNNMLYLNAY